MPLRVASFPSCRANDLFSPLEECPDALHRSLADEVYWLSWKSTFSGDATIRVARLGSEVLASRRYRPSMFMKARSTHALSTTVDWSRLEDAVVAANFWMLDETIMDMGCDGSTWIIAGRRRHDYHRIRRWSPPGPLYDLGRLLFDLVGLDEVRL
jgi:hypothetical protein